MPRRFGPVSLGCDTHRAFWLAGSVPAGGNPSPGSCSPRPRNTTTGSWRTFRRNGGRARRIRPLARERADRGVIVVSVLDQRPAGGRAIESASPGVVIDPSSVDIGFSAISAVSRASAEPAASIVFTRTIATFCGRGERGRVRPVAPSDRCRGRGIVSTGMLDWLTLARPSCKRQLKNKAACFKAPAFGRRGTSTI